jgi:hypothetical protein
VLETHLGAIIAFGLTRAIGRFYCDLFAGIFDRKP